MQLPLMQGCFSHCPGMDTWQLWSTSSHLMRTHMTSAKLATTVSKLIDGIEEIGLRHTAEVPDRR